jgi:hypothetical protein
MWPFTRFQAWEPTEPVAPVDVCDLLTALRALKDDPLTEGFEADSSSGMYSSIRIRFSGVVVAEISHLWTAGDAPRITAEGYELGEPLFQIMQAIVDENTRRVAAKKEIEYTTARTALVKARAALAARETKEGKE